MSHHYCLFCLLPRFSVIVQVSDLFRWLLYRRRRAPANHRICRNTQSHCLPSLSVYTCRTFDFDSEIILFRAFSEALTHFPPGPLSWCLFGDISFFGGFWNLSCVDISFRFEILLSAVRTECSVPSNYRLFLIFPIQQILLTFLPEKVYGYRKVPLSGFAGLARRATRNFFPGHDDVIRHLCCFFTCKINWNPLRWYWNN